MNLTIFKHKKIFVFFSLGIVLPCFILSYFAYRGIKNDLALVEKEDRIICNQIVKNIKLQTYEHFSKCENKFAQVLKAPQNNLEESFFKKAQSIKQAYPIVEDIFLIDSSNKIQFFPAPLLYYEGQSPNDNYKLSNKKKSEILNLLENANKYEFQQKRYSLALQTYKSAFKQLINHEVKGFILNSIARIQVKMQNIDEAILSYEKLVNDYNLVRLFSNIPIGLSSQYELCSLYMKNDTTKAIKNSLELYSKLLNVTWRLEKAQFDFYSSLLHQLFDRVFPTRQSSHFLNNYENNYEDLKKSEKELRKKTDRLLVFQEKVVPFLFDLDDLNAGNKKNVSIEIEKEPFFLILHKYFIGNSNQTSLIGFLIDLNYIKKELLPTLISNQNIDNKFIWQIKNRNGGIILQSDEKPSGKFIVKEFFIDNAPPWSLEFYYHETNPFETLFTSSRRIYFYFFILIAVILVFGLFLVLNVLNQELKLSTMKSNFVTAVSHDLKSPLTSIRQIAEMLHDGRVSSKQRQQEYYKILVEQSERLSSQIENVLDSEKMNQGKILYNFEKTNIIKLVEDIITQVQQQVKNSDFVIRFKTKNVDDIPDLMLDQQKIQQVVFNLLDNAIKFSDRNRAVEVDLFKKSHEIIISIKDYGIGIQKSEQKQIFERFYRSLSKRTENIKGSGLGLTLVKQIIEAHSGQVLVESELNKGSIFSIRLPIENAREQHGENSFN